METCEILKKLREQKGMSQQEVADVLNISRTAYVKYESGASKPVRKLNELAKLFHVTTDFILGAELDVTKLSNYAELQPQTKKVPIIGSVKCGPGGLAYQYLEGFVYCEERYQGDIVAFRCIGDSMKDAGIDDEDLVLVRIQPDLENGDIGIIVYNGYEGTLKRFRRFKNGIILEAANPAYEPMVITGEGLNDVHIVGKAIEVRKKL